MMHVNYKWALNFLVYNWCLSRLEELWELLADPYNVSNIEMCFFLRILSSFLSLVFS